MMIKFWLRIRLRTKIMLLGISFIMLFSFITLVYFIPSIKNDSIEKKRQGLKNIVDIAEGMMDTLKFESDSGRMDEDEARSRAIYYTGRFRYGEEKLDSIWVLGTDGVVCSMPFREDMVGRNVTKLEDQAMKGVYQKIIEMCGGSGEGFIDYTSQYKSEVTKKVPVISYVRLYKPFNLIIGTSVYIEDVRGEIYSLYVRILAVTVLIVIAALVMLFATATGITVPIRGIVRGISGSDLNTELKTDLKDEIGDLAFYFNRFVSSIKDIITDIRDASDNLAVSSVELSDLSSSFAEKANDQNRFSLQAAATVERIADEFDRIAAHIDQEFEKLSSLIEIMNRLSDIIDRLDSRTGEAAVIINGITENAHNGESSLRLMLEIISKFGERSHDMNNIVAMINDISDRINLLSLNASIEAARAGDAGRGFAVVANEVSKLADATSQSMKQISGIIVDNTKELEEGIAYVESTVRIIGRIIGDFGSVKGLIEGLSSQVKEQIGTKGSVQDEVNLIVSMSDNIRKREIEQKRGIDEIRGLMKKINEGTDGIMSGSEELWSGSKEVASMSEKLKGKISIFKI